MMNYQAGDVLLVTFPHTAGGTVARRPALVLLDSGDKDVLLARITSQGYSTPYDVSLADWKGAGLLTPSVVRLHKLATIEKALIQRPLGALQGPDRAVVSAVLNKTLGNW
jgi:mRNA interferase MazF